MSELLARQLHPLLYLLDDLVVAQSSEMFNRVVADHFIGVGVVNILPKETGGLSITAMLPHARGQHLQKRMRAGNPRATLEGFRSSDVVVLLNIVNEPKMKIKMPVVGDLADAALDELSSEVGTSRTLRRLLRKENRPKPIGRLKLGIQRDCDIQQRIQKIVF